MRKYSTQKFILLEKSILKKAVTKAPNRIFVAEKEESKYGKEGENKRVLYSNIIKLAKQ